MKTFLIILAGITGVLALTEIGLRLIMGLGTPPLYTADPEIGYLLAPNQKLQRQGSLYETNQYSMRSSSLKAEVDKRILLLGDSVVNGSWWTDQSETLDRLLTQKLQDTVKSDVEVLNISANSWSTQNELAYLQRFGLFDASTLVLVINTDDLFATEPTSLAVGTPSYPTQNPKLALIEYFQLFIAEPKPIPELNELKQSTSERDRLTQNLAAISEIKAIADNANTEFILVLTPLLREFETGSTESELAARTRLQELVDRENINYLDILSAWADFPQPEFLYRDRIHPTPQGNIKLVEAILERLSTVNGK